MKPKTAKMLVQSVATTVLLISLANTSPVYSKTIEIKNNSGHTVTLTDLIAYPGDKNQGTPTPILKKNDPNDDVNIANGGQKNYNIENAKSVTISWKNSSGVEVETDAGTGPFEITEDKLLAMFDSSFGGSYAIDYNPPYQIPPAESSVFNVIDGKIEGSVYDCATFYDVTASGGLIERDAFGNPTSPLLDGETVTVSSIYGLYVQESNIPTVSQWGLIILTLLLLTTGIIIVHHRRGVLT